MTLVDTRGDPERPLDAAGIEAKARTLFEWGGLSGQQADAGVASALRGRENSELVRWIEEAV